ncbi:HipO: hippurate hydrolase (benzoylglycine amidohydrolase) [Desulfosarcina variabilis str. Montpellier]|uniref:M20 aminoacylase family protein n=1 Tax=Desulfosarcina variabilis TaxID=2300 RepID=UPI003AFA0E10
MNALLSDVSKVQNQMAEWRHEIHKHPETAFEEVKTSAYVASLLESWGYEVVTGIGKTGIVASLKAGQGEKTIGLRADMDALPVTEAVESDYKSQTPGKMHACGHDGHTAMLLGAAKYLADKKNFNGTVRLVFQPAEETISGASAMIADGLLERFPMDAIFGMHNMPTLEQGKFFFRAGPMMAAVDNWEIELTGKGSHGSMPEKSIDPIVAGASLVMALQTIVSRNVAPMQSAVVTVGAFIAGDAGNVIPQSSLLRLSIRSTEDDTRQLVLNRIREITAAQAQAYGVSYTLREGPPGAVLVNEDTQTEFAAQVARDVFGADKVSMDAPKLMGSEDFAFFIQDKPGTYCFIGNGDTPMVHNPDYQFDDRNLSIGAAYWVALTQAFLK